MTRGPATPRSALAALRDGAAGDLAQRHGLDLLVAFGSVVRTDGQPRDLDLAVRSAGALDVLALLQDVYELTGLEEVDVLDLRRAGAVAAFEALEHGVLLYESHPGRFVEAHVGAWSLHADEAWLRRRQLESLAR